MNFICKIFGHSYPHWDKIMFCSRCGHSLKTCSDIPPPPKRQHKLHSHPGKEAKEGVPPDRVLVDDCFKELFTRIYGYWDSNHILVSKEEFNVICNN